MGKNNKGKGNRFKEKTYGEGDTIRKLELLAEKRGIPIWQLNPNEMESFSEDSENEVKSGSSDDENNAYKCKKDKSHEENENDKNISDNCETNNLNDEKKIIDILDEEEEVITSMNTPLQNEKINLSEEGM